MITLEGWKYRWNWRKKITFFFVNDVQKSSPQTPI